MTKPGAKARLEVVHLVEQRRHGELNEVKTWERRGAEAPITLGRRGREGSGFVCMQWHVCDCALCGNSAESADVFRVGTFGPPNHPIIGLIRLCCNDPFSKRYKTKTLNYIVRKRTYKRDDFSVQHPVHAKSAGQSSLRFSPARGPLELKLPFAKICILKAGYDVLLNEYREHHFFSGS